MICVYYGVQKHICDIEPNVQYTHCADPNLNFAINDAIKEVLDMGIF